MVTVCGSTYQSYDEAAYAQLGVSKNSLYRYYKRENLPKKTIVEIIEYCVDNGIARDQILSKRKRHFDKSFEEAMIDQYGIDNYKKMFIPEENIINPKEVGYQSDDHVNIHCLCTPPHFIEDIAIKKVFNISEGRCPYKSHTAGNKYILKEDSLSYLYPLINPIWSEKNTDLPEKIYPTAVGEYWFKCENGFHGDYPRRLASQVSILSKRNENICPECNKLFGYAFEDLSGKQFGELTVLELDKRGTFLHSLSSSAKSTRTCKVWKCQCSCGAIVPKDANSLKNGGVKNCGDKSIHYSGENNPNWRGGITTEHETIRKSQEYKEWRLAVYRKDNYTCQACGKQKRGDNIELHAHHIVSFSSLLQCDKERLFDINNGITLCSECHFSNNVSSLHNIYGTDDVSPSELEEFINTMRRGKGIKEVFSLSEYMKGQIPIITRQSNPKRSRINPNSIASKCRDSGISRSTYNARIKRGWSADEALRLPSKGGRKECEDHKGVGYPSVAEMCRKWNIRRDAFDNRIKNGWGLKEALETPIKHENTEVQDFNGNIFGSIKKMCEHYGVKPVTYSLRVKKLGWTQEQALTGNRGRQKNVIDYNGDTFLTEREMCEKHGVPYSTFLKRKARGMSIREALGG